MFTWLNCDNMAASMPFPVTDSVCFLCTSSLKDSVVLRCCHSLCKKCVQSYWELNKSLECPVCLRETHCSVLLHRLSISRFASEGESSQDRNFKPLHVGNAESEMVSELDYTSLKRKLHVLLWLWNITGDLLWWRYRFYGLSYENSKVEELFETQSSDSVQ